MSSIISDDATFRKLTFFCIQEAFTHPESRPALIRILERFLPDRQAKFVDKEKAWPEILFTKRFYKEHEGSEDLTFTC